MSYAGAIEYLYGLQRLGIKFGLENSRSLLAALGSPERLFGAVHVAGTNGKGSTSAIIAEILMRAGLKTGLFTSPHLVSFTERIRVNGSEIKEKDVVRLAERVRSASEEAGLNPTFFEVVTAMGFLHFRESGAECAVVETGMGGRLDATNVLAPAVSVITKIGFDHREFLGESLGEIALEKAGIIKPGVPLAASSQEKDAMEVLYEKAGEIYVSGRDFLHRVTSMDENGVVFDYEDKGGLRLNGLSLPLTGGHQAENASLAIMSAKLFLKDPPDFQETVREALCGLKWPGRLEKISSSPPVYIDGAHNPPAAKALANALKEIFLKGNKTLILVIGVMADKDVKGILEPLLPLASHVVFTRPSSERAADASELSRIAAELGYRSVKTNTVSEAISLAAGISGGGSLILATGSFYTIGEARRILGHMAEDEKAQSVLSALSDPWHKGKGK